MLAVWRATRHVIAAHTVSNQTEARRTNKKREQQRVLLLDGGGAARAVLGVGHDPRQRLQLVVLLCDAIALRKHRCRPRYELQFRRE